MRRSDGIRWKLKPAQKITREQYDTILKAANPRDQMILFVAMNLTLRISEVLHLRVSDFDPSTGVNIVRRKKKTLEAETLAVAEGVVNTVRQYADEKKLTPDDWLFPGSCSPCFRTLTFVEKKDGRVVKKWKERQGVCDGGHLTVRRAQIVWDAILKRLGLKVPRRGIHTLRHLSATEFYRATRDVFATQERCGHNSVDTTRTYVEAVEMQERANQVGVIGAIPSSKRPSKGSSSFSGKTNIK